MFVKSAVKAQLSAELCPSCYVDCNHIDRLGEDMEWNPGRNRGQEGYGRWERKEPEVGVLKGLEVGEFCDNA